MRMAIEHTEKKRKGDVSFRCPVCGRALEKKEKSLLCPEGHSFDISSKGYVNLLLANQKNSRLPGDDPASLAARRAFLEKGYYQCLSDGINRTAIALTGEAPHVADCCCGEGYYIRRLCQALAAAGKQPDCLAFDISKKGVAMAASRRREENIRFAAASVFNIPLPDGKLDFALHCFAPFCAPELERVLKKGGCLLGVIPGRRHLFSMKKVLYDTPYENDEKGYTAQGFLLEDRIRVERETVLTSGEDIRSLFAMTPYYYRTSRRAAERLEKMEELPIEFEFIIQVFRKK